MYYTFHVIYMIWKPVKLIYPKCEIQNNANCDILLVSKNRGCMSTYNHLTGSHSKCVRCSGIIHASGQRVKCDSNESKTRFRH